MHTGLSVTILSLSVFDLFGLVTSRKSRRAAPLHCFIPILVGGALNQNSLVLTLHRPNIAEAIQKNLGSFTPRKSHFFGLMYHWAYFSGMENYSEYESRFRPLYTWDWASLYWPFKELNLLLFRIGFIWQTTNTPHDENVLPLTLIVYIYIYI